MQLIIGNGFESRKSLVDPSVIKRIIEAYNKAKVVKIYSNFFRESCSWGLHGLPVDMESSYFSSAISE